MKNNIDYPSATSSHLRKTLVTALLLAGIGQTDITYAAVLNTGDVLTITAGVTGGSYSYVTGGSYFAPDTNGDGTFSAIERAPIQQGTQGILVGMAQPTGISHMGAPTGTEGGTIDAAWLYFGNTGMHFTASPITGGTTTGLDFSGWRVTWNGIPSIFLGGGIQDCGTSTDGICVDFSSSTDIAGTYNNGTGLATFTWSGVYGAGYTLNYFAVVPRAASSGFGGLPYALHLEGIVNQAAVVPIPAAVWLFGSGLTGLFAMPRRRHRT